VTPPGATAAPGFTQSQPPPGDKLAEAAAGRRARPDGTFERATMQASTADIRPAGLLSTRPDTLLASALLNLAALAVPVLMLQLYDRIIPNGSYSTLLVLVPGVLLAIATEAGLRHARAAICAWVAAQEEHALSRAALERLLRADPRAIPPPGVAADAMAAIAEWRAHRTGALAHTLADLPFMLVFLGFLAWLSPLLALVAVLAALPGAIAAAALAPIAARAIAQRSAAEASRHGLTQESLSAIEAIKAMAAEALLLRRHERLVAATALAGRRTTATLQACRALAAAGSQTVVCAVALAGAAMVIQGTLSGGAVAAAILRASRGLEPLARLAAGTPNLARALGARRRAGLLLRLPQEEADRPAPPPLTEIALEGVDIAHPHGGLLLQEVSLRLRVGECVALQGPGGSGKTRLLLTLAGLVPPDRGRILVDGVPSEALSPQALRGQVALLPQRPVLLPGRVIDNLTGFDPDRQAEALHLAAELGLDACFDRLAAGYATEVGHGDAQDLPPSIAERVVAVRALIARPRLILLDDATASQDRDGDSRMRALIGRLRREAAVLVVTERPEWLALADRRLRVAEGRVLPAA
jgi:ABC-type bacteriocin/lantibiotic exporter with double-glycine peptidase domain